MKGRIPMIWLALLTIYQSYITTDARTTLKDVEASQEVTLKYMEKTAAILKKFKKLHVPAEVVSAPAIASTK